MTSRCIYHLLVLPLLSCWARWVTHRLSGSHLFASALFLSYLCNSIGLFPPFFFFLNTSSICLSLFLLLGLWNCVSPWWISRVWKPLNGIDECTSRSFSSLLGGAKSVLQKKKKRGKGWKRNRRSWKWKRDKKEWDGGRLRAIALQGALCTLLGRYLNLGVCDAALPCFISLFPFHTALRKPFTPCLCCEEP